VTLPQADDAEPLSTREQLVELGAMLRRARQGRFTLEKLSARSGVSVGLISQIERGLGNPSFVTLSKLAYALDIPVSSFFADAGDRGALVRRHQRRQLLLESEGLVFELLTPDIHRKLGLTLVSIPPGWSNEPRPFAHDAEEAVFLVSGQLELHVGPDSYTLHEGDTVTYDANLPHWMRNLGTASAVVLTAMTPPTF
jgi:transcriptional regulator with XRE-family HTH domain